MFLKNILIDTAIKKDESKQRSSGTSVYSEERVICFPGRVYLENAERLSWYMACISAKEFTAKKIFGVIDCSIDHHWEEQEMNWFPSLLEGNEVLRHILAHLLQIMHVLDNCWAFYQQACVFSSVFSARMPTYISYGRAETITEVHDDCQSRHDLKQVSSRFSHCTNVVGCYDKYNQNPKMVWIMVSIQVQAKCSYRIKTCIIGMIL